MRPDNARISLAIALAVIAGWFLRVLVELEPDLFRTLGALIGVATAFTLFIYATGGKRP